MNNVVYVYKCEGSTLTVKGKVNNVVLDSCKKCSLLFDSVVASVEFVNCQSVQMQVSLAFFRFMFELKFVMVSGAYFMQIIINGSIEVYYTD